MLSTIVLALLVTGGCMNGRRLSGARPEPRTARTAHQLQVERLKKQIAELEAERDVLTGKLERVEANERRLFRRLRELQFANDRQADQIKHLATVPLERDRYKARVNALTDQVVALQRKIARLELARPAKPPAPAAVTTPPPTTTPAKPPARPGPLLPTPGIADPPTPSPARPADSEFKPPVRVPPP